MMRKDRDWVDWIELGIGLIEVSLTVLITWMIWTELGIGKRQDELLSRKPAISFSREAFSVQVVPPDIREHPLRFTDDFPLSIANNGTAALQNGSVVIYARESDVTISCPKETGTCRRHYEPPWAFPGIDFDLGTLGVRRAAHIKFSVSYMSSRKPFDLHLMVAGDNIVPVEIGKIPIDPTPPPEPK